MVTMVINHNVYLKNFLKKSRKKRVWVRVNLKKKTQSLKEKQTEKDATWVKRNKIEFKDV